MMESQNSTATPPLPSDVPAPKEIELASLELENLVPGAKWRSEAYLIEEVLPDITFGKSLRAKELKTARSVVIRSFRVSDDARERAWNRMGAEEGSCLLGRIWAATAEGRRVEITEAPGSRTLTDWFAGRKAAEDEVQWLVKGLCDAVSRMHACGVAHLNLKPGNIHVRESEAGPQIVLGGLETLVDITRPELMSVSIDPFYAPPEAVGLLQHYAGPAFRAWDWWTVGRVVQEAVLGGHVLGLLIERDVSRHTPELLIRADQFLREKDIARSRPGGVELMPALDENIRTLLRGLLASCRDARWSSRDVHAWLDKKLVRERYDLARTTRLFVWRDYAYSLPEIAEVLAERENVASAVEEIFGAARRDSLFSFIEADSTSRGLAGRLKDLTELETSSGFAGYPKAALREAVAMTALGLIHGGSANMKIRGLPVSADNLKSLLAGAPDDQVLSLVEVLSEPALFQSVAQFDSAAGRVLGDLSRGAGAAIALGASHHWLSRADRVALSRIHQILLTGEAEQQAALAEARLKFAVNRNEDLDTMFRKEHPGSAELCVLLFTLGRAEHFGYVTHEDWNEEQRAKLNARGEALAQALTWQNLCRVIRVGPLVIGPVFLAVVFWMMVAAAVALRFSSRPTLMLAGGTFAAAIIARLLLRKTSLAALRRHATSGGKGFPSAATCEEQSRKALGSLSAQGVSEMKRQLAETNAALAALPNAGGRVPARVAENFIPQRILCLVLTTAGLAAFVLLGLGVLKSPPKWEGLKTAWFSPPPAPSKGAMAAEDSPGKTTAAQEGVGEENPTPEAKAGNSVLGGLFSSGKKSAQESTDIAQVTWGFREPLDLPLLKTLETLDATEAQAADALEQGREKARPYIPATVNTLIALRVMADNRVGLMLFDAKSGKLADQHLHIVPYLPMPRSWFLLGNRTAIYLGEN